MAGAGLTAGAAGGRGAAGAPRAGGGGRAARRRCARAWGRTGFAAVLGLGCSVAARRVSGLTAWPSARASAAAVRARTVSLPLASAAPANAEEAVGSVKFAEQPVTGRTT